MDKLNPEEILTGCLYGFVWVIFLGWWVIPVLAGTSFLWAFGGAAGTSKSWRRWGVPLVTCSALALVTWSWLPLLSIIPFYGVLTLGYGIPSVNPYPKGDKGSWLGRLCTWLMTGSVAPPPVESEMIITMLCRCIIAVLAALTMLPLAWISVWAWLVGLVLLLVGTLLVEIL